MKTKQSTADTLTPGRTWIPKFEQYDWCVTYAGCGAWIAHQVTLIRLYEQPVAVWMPLANPKSP